MPESGPPGLPLFFGPPTFLDGLRAGALVVIHDSNHPEIMQTLRPLEGEFFRQDRFGPCHGVKNFRAWTLLAKDKPA